MGAAFLPAALIDVRRNLNLVVEPRIQCHGGEQTTSRTESPAEEATNKRVRKCGFEFRISNFAITNLKYLIIVTIVSLVAAFVYLRLRPYLQLIRKVVGALNVSTEAAVPRERSPSKNKLVRCDSCGTWVPADRVFRLNSGLATYCSRECLANKADAKEQKLVG